MCRLSKTKETSKEVWPSAREDSRIKAQLCVDLIGPYKIKSNVKGVKIPPLKCISMIDLAIGWLRLNNMKTKSQSQLLTNIVEQEWLT